MKRTILAISAILTAAALAGCSGSNDDTDSQAPRLAADSVSFDWQAPYLEQLEKFRKSPDFKPDSAFDIVDFLGDSTPELIISQGTDPGDVCTIFTASDGVISEIGQIGKGGWVTYLPELDLYRDEYCGDGFVIGSFQSLTDYGFVQEISYSDNSSAGLEAGKIERTIDGEYVLLPDYEERMNPYFSAKSVTYGRRFGFGEAGVNLGIRCSESWGAALYSHERQYYRLVLLDCLDGKRPLGEDPAFELCDLDGDGLPELIVSQGSGDQDQCLVFTLRNGNLTDFDPIGYKGQFSFDPVNHGVFYEKDGMRYTWRMDGEEISTEQYGADGNYGVIGRKYELNNDNIYVALS